MNKVIEIRNKWDEIFNAKAVSYFVKIFGAICIGISTIALTRLFPFIDILGERELVFIALLVPFAYIVKEELAVCLYAVIIFFALSNGNGALGMIAGLLSIFVCGNCRFICTLAMLIPWLLMNITEIENPLLSLNLGYLIFFICVYFNEKLASNGWKYAFTLYYTIAAYYFGLYGQVVKDFFQGTWPEYAYTNSAYNPWDAFNTYAKLDEYFATLDVASLSILILLNLILCYTIYKVMGLKNIKYLNMSIEIRDAIVFLSAIAMTVVIMFGITKLYNPELKGYSISIIIQGIGAYVLTRPFASHAICRELKKKRSNYEEGKSVDLLESGEFSRSIKEEIESVLETYLNQSKYEAILSADKIPTNAILIYGKQELDKGLIVENILGRTGLETVYYRGDSLLREYRENGKIELFEALDNGKKLKVIVIDKIEGLVNGTFAQTDFGKALQKYFVTMISSQSANLGVLFIMTTEMPEILPEALYDRTRISKVLYGMQDDSILLNGTYRLIRPIGKGGGGIVYQAYHERLDVNVVVKKIKNHISGKNSYKAEAEVLKRIKHTYLPKVYDVFAESEDYYTVMDYVPGHDLQEELLRRGCISQGTVLKWGKQLVQAIGYLHSQNPPIIHSDIKPSNIMLMPDGNVCLIDFNISLIFDKTCNGVGVTPGFSPIEQYGSIENYEKKLESIEKTPGVRVTPQSAALAEDTVPLDINGFMDSQNEAIESKNTGIEANGIFEGGRISYAEMSRYAYSGLSEKSDIYSLGVVMYTLLTGIKPQPDFNKIKPISLCDVNLSQRFAVIIEKMMCVNPGDRYQNIYEVERDLKQL